MNVIRLFHSISFLVVLTFWHSPYHIPHSVMIFGSQFTVSLTTNDTFTILSYIKSQDRIHLPQWPFISLHPLSQWSFLPLYLSHPGTWLYKRPLITDDSTSYLTITSNNFLTSLRPPLYHILFSQFITFFIFSYPSCSDNIHFIFTHSVGCTAKDTKNKWKGKLQNRRKHLQATCLKKS